MSIQVRGRLIENMLRGMAALLLFAALSCDMGGSYGGGTGDGTGGGTERTLTIFLGDAGNGGYRAISTAAPSFPALSTVVITVTKGGAAVASGTFSGNGPHTISVPDGSGYRVELDAQVASPLTFGRRYAGVVNNVSTGNPVYVSLSVTEMAIVARDSGNLYVYSSFASTGPSPDRTISGYSFFFDRYGRLFTYNMAGIFSMFSNIGDSAGQQATLSGVDSIMDMAHSAGSDIVYLWNLYNGGPLVADFAFVRLSDMAGGSVTYTPITITPGAFPAPFTGFTAKYLGVSGDTVFLGGETASFVPAFIKGTVDTGTNTFTFIDGVQVPGIDTSALSDMKVVNGTVCMLGSLPGFFDREILFAYNADTLAPLGSALVQAPISIFAMMGMIAGRGKNKVYVYYIGSGPAANGIVEIDTTSVTISNRRDW